MTDTKDILLKIDEQQYIKIVMDCPDQIFFHRFDPVLITLCDKQKKYILSEHDHLGPELETLNWFFNTAINGELELAEFINADLGYLYNQEIHYRSTISKKNTDRRIHYYLVFDGNQNTTWLYTKKGSIFLQITPAYKWHFSDPEEGEEFVHYDEFIKNYASCLTVEIPKEVLSIWIAQCDEIMKLIIKNDGGIEPT